MRDPEETRGIGKKDISKHIVTQKRNINHFRHLLLGLHSHQKLRKENLNERLYVKIVIAEN